ncbi:hypothetical protein [Actinokineospora globicatena]|uniref:Uncharacterized protein n=1 Tax=Actinokineospora globicatena TaxID=103729 RepID=A0A9W6QSY1_9PSEU|nr:hypothetical protein [Actinokineospora globicatena]MCP2304951.1 hypothetical protein [Actinokineospora globicatena]GLW80411.1 hypothetical protein Aglo01_48920 [Actinokineospora globicatena]GLW87239.1 hypothetical protein Aglo02_48780 [Actinokineospora globicatena]GLW94027.1 hypothetical protein Aglo03_48430 [Actinokineospora globicatena]
MTSTGRQFVVTTEVTVTVFDEEALLGADEPNGAGADTASALRAAVDPRAVVAGVAGVQAGRVALRVRPAWPGPA